MLNILLVVIALLFSFFSSTSAYKLYDRIFKDPDSFLDASFLIGFPLAFIFILIFLFTAFGRLKKYWWVGILSIPPLLFILYFDWQHIYFPIALGIIGWLLGQLILKLRKKLFA